MKKLFFAIGLAPTLLLVFVISAFTAMTTPLLAHEFWLDPVAYQVEAGGNVQVHIRNGQGFQGINLAYFDQRIELFDWLQNGARFAITSRAGDTPALNVADASDGLVVLAYQSSKSVTTYRDWEKFTDFVTHKGFPEAIERHRARGLPDIIFKEIYTRFCKTLIAVGTGSGQDAPTGMEIEIVALANPYVDDVSGGMPVQVFYRGAARDNAQIEVFARAPDGQVVTSIVITDTDGRAVIDVLAGHEYLLDSVVLREPSNALAAEKDVVWESLWASLTFGVPN